MTEDLVNHPKHYTSHPSGLECIQVTRHMNFNLGNAVKYIWRCGEKGDAIQDLEKAIWYLKDEIKRLQFKQDEEGNKCPECGGSDITACGTCADCMKEKGCCTSCGENTNSEGHSSLCPTCQEMYEHENAKD